jgi:very-short-patch-repair endonuclease
MDELDLLLRANGGVLATTQAARVGLTSNDLDRFTRAGRLVRVRRGAFVDGQVYRGAHVAERYRLRVSAVMATRPTGDLAAHHAAIALWRLPLWQVNLSRIDVLADVAGDFAESGVWFHPRGGLSGSRTASGPVVTVARALVQTAAIGHVQGAVVAADAALAQRLCRRADLAAELAVEPRVRGHRRAARMVDLCDGRSESVGESRLRMVLRGAGFAVRSQVALGDDNAVFARVDFLVGDRVIVEFDGALKYSGDPSGRALFDEKRREDRLRQLGFEVVRVTWADLEHPDRVLAWIRSALARAERRRPA